MELLLELLLTAAISFIFAFFLAKLISLASSADLDQDLVESVISTVDHAQFPVSQEKIEAMSTQELEYEQDRQSEGSVLVKGIEAELQFDGQDDAILPLKEEAEIVKDCDEEDGVGLEEKSSEDVESDTGLGKEEEKIETVCESDRIDVKEGLESLEKGKSGDLDLEEAKEEKESERDGEIDVGLVKEEVGSNKDGLDVVNFARSDGDFAKEGEREVEDAENAVEKGGADGEKGSLFNEDEWEGIERSELEKRFDTMASMVGSGSGDVLSKIGSDVQMQLYGLHKVATEGPCYEPQPSVLKVSARAKWHAWQRMGNMNPEEAMEQYINLLSGSIPGWIGEKSEDSKKQEEADDSLEEPVCGSKAPDLSSSPHHVMSSENERKSEEIHLYSANVDAIGCPKFLEQGDVVKDDA